MPGADTPEAQEAEAQHRAMMAALEATGSSEAATMAAGAAPAEAVTEATSGPVAAASPPLAAEGDLLGDEQGPGEWVVKETGTVYVENGGPDASIGAGGGASGAAAQAAAAVMELGGVVASAAVAAATAVSSTLQDQRGSTGSSAADSCQEAGNGHGADGVGASDMQPESVQH